MPKMFVPDVLWRTARSRNSPVRMPSVRRLHSSLMVAIRFRSSIGKSIAFLPRRLAVRVGPEALSQAGTTVPNGVFDAKSLPVRRPLPRVRRCRRSAELPLSRTTRRAHQFRPTGLFVMRFHPGGGLSDGNGFPRANGGESRARRDRSGLYRWCLWFAIAGLHAAADAAGQDRAVGVSGLRAGINPARSDFSNSKGWCVMSNGNNRPVGRCGECGGIVSLPIYFHSVNRPVPTCESCGAVEDTAARLPKLPMKPRIVPRPRWHDGKLSCSAMPETAWC